MRTVASFNRPFDAHMLIARLESSGIPAFARDEHMVTLDWLASNAIGGVKVDVADEDYEKALAVMAAPPTKDSSSDQASPNTQFPPLDFGIWGRIVMFLFGAVPLAIVFYAMTPAPQRNPAQRIGDEGPYDSRPLTSLFAGTLGGFLVLVVTKRKRPNKAPEPTTMAVTSRAPSSTSRASHGRGSS